GTDLDVVIASTARTTGLVVVVAHAEMGRGSGAAEESRGENIAVRHRRAVTDEAAAVLSAAGASPAPGDQATEHERHRDELGNLCVHTLLLSKKTFHSRFHLPGRPASRIAQRSCR